MYLLNDVHAVEVARVKVKVRNDNDVWVNGKGVGKIKVYVQAAVNQLQLKYN